MQVVVIQILLGVLDLMGVAVIGVIGLVTIKGVQSQEASGGALRFLSFAGLSDNSFQSQVAILGTVAALALILRTLLSLFFNWKIMKFLSSRSASIADDLLSRFVGAGQINLHDKSVAEVRHILGPGVFSISTGVLGTASTLVTDVSSVIMISTAIIIIDPLVGSFSILLFSLVGLFLYFGLRRRVETLGKEFSNQSIIVDRLIQELFFGYRQIYTGNRIEHYFNSINQSRSRIAKLYAIHSFIPGLGKYVIEITIIIGGLVTAASLFVFSDSARAFAGLGIFIASGARVAPALLRLQQGTISIKSNLSISYLTINLINQIKHEPRIQTFQTVTDFKHKDFTPKLEISNLKYRHKNRSDFELQVEELKIEPGSFIAIVGPSGSGKTTFIDLLLGLYKPESGTILLSGMSPNLAISRWPGATAYVPQDIYIKEGSIKQNVAMGYTENEISDHYVVEALRTAQLTNYVNTLPLGIETTISERGNNLSGGQRQRLGIARALYSKPKLLILDEATSSLDGIVEEDITFAISQTLSTLTRIVIAHRLSTVRNADSIIYISGGNILSSGSFNQVRSEVPDFDKSAGLLGL
jgi:ABC-type bacteriocin/lantibiotic exporter with double-glycine peptidase domain